MRTYKVQYKMFEADGTSTIEIVADNKAKAWDIAEYEIIPRIEGRLPYSAWVSCQITKDGNEHYFNNHEGNPF